MNEESKPSSRHYHAHLRAPRDRFDAPTQHQHVCTPKAVKRFFRLLFLSIVVFVRFLRFVMSFSNPSPRLASPRLASPRQTTSSPPSSSSRTKPPGGVRPAQRWVKPNAPPEKWGPFGWPPVRSTNVGSARGGCAGGYARGGLSRGSNRPPAAQGPLKRPLRRYEKRSDLEYSALPTCPTGIAFARCPVSPAALASSLIERNARRLIRDSP